MAFPASNTSLSKAWADMQRDAGIVKSTASAALTDLDSDVTSAYVLQLRNSTIKAIAKFQSYVTIPGFVQYVKDQLGDQNIDITAEYNTMLTAMEAVRDWIEANHPVDGNGFILEKKFNSVNFEQRTFAPAVTAPLKALEQTLYNSIA